MSLDQLEEAISLINRDQPEAARPLLIEYLKNRPKDEVAWRYLTRVLPTIDQKIGAIEHCLRLNPHSKWAQDALEKLIDEQKKIRGKQSRALPPKPQVVKQDLIPAGIFEAGDGPSGPGIDWGKRDKKGDASGSSTSRKSRPSALPGGVAKRRGLGRFRFLKPAFIGAGVLSLGVMTVIFLLGRANNPGVSANTPGTETQAALSASMATGQSATETPQKLPTPTIIASPTAERASSPFTLPEVQPIAGYPAIDTRNAPRTVLLSQWFVDDAVSLAFSPDGRMLAVGGWDGTVWIWETLTLLGSPWGRGQDLYHYNQPFGVNSVAFSPDGNSVAFGISAINEPLRIIDLSKLQASSEVAIRSLEGHKDGVKSVAFSPDGSVLATSSFDNTVRLWDPATGQELGMIEGLYIEKVVFSPDSTALATAYFDHGYSTFVWDFPRLMEQGNYSPEEATMLDGGPGAVFSLDGEKFVTAEERITIWAAPGIVDNDSPQNLRTLLGHTELVQCLALTPDGLVLASGARDRKIKLWDMVTGRELTTLVGHEDRLHSLAFSPDGSILASAADDGIIRLWGIAR
jgi:WD40 repeat protein